MIADAPPPPLQMAATPFWPGFMCSARMLVMRAPDILNREQSTSSGKQNHNSTSIVSIQYVKLIFVFYSYITMNKGRARVGGRDWPRRRWGSDEPGRARAAWGSRVPPERTPRSPPTRPRPPSSRPSAPAASSLRTQAPPGSRTAPQPSPRILRAQ